MLGGTLRARRSSIAAMAAKKLSPPNGTEKFQRAINAELGRSMKGWLKSKKKSKLLFDEIHKEIFELGPPDPPGQPTGRGRYIQKLTHHFTEILRAIDTMKDIEFYVGRFPYSKAAVAKHRHLQFHVEAFLQELYILQLRLTQLLTFIERSRFAPTTCTGRGFLTRRLRGFRRSAFTR
jgi:hypothetical protein